MTEPLRIRRALVSVSDKTGLTELGRALTGHGIEILSTGGSAEYLREAGCQVTDVSAITGFPEVMGGRVKTLHPAIHGGILARAGTDDDTLDRHGIAPIDLVVVNLYPFADTVARSGCTLEEAIENIDIGGPALLRAAAKNHARVTVVSNPGDYADILKDLPRAPDQARRKALATAAFAHTAAYDGRISQWLSEQESGEQESGNALPEFLNLNLHRTRSLRYGENPHQSAAVYIADSGGASLAETAPLQGKALSYNNLLDADAAWSGVHALGERPACVIVKHNNPCGAALADSITAAYRKALACDPTSAFGGIVAFNRTVDAECARAVTGQFLEVLIAPGIDDDAREVLAGKPNVRVLAPGQPLPGGPTLRRIDGGWLAQDADDLTARPGDFRIATTRGPDETESRDLMLAWQVVKLVRSNAIVYVNDGATVGIGAGQMSRIDAARIATMKAADAGLNLKGAVMASDAFFPFADSIETAAEAGIRAVIQPGGSKRDTDVIAAADARGMAMIITGRRHFRH